MTIKHLTSLLALICFLVVVGCGGPSDYAGSLSISIGDGDQPSISWSPNCKAYGLIVEGKFDFGDVWVVSSGEGFGSSVRYGETPRNAINRDGPESLVSGRQYTILIYNNPRWHSDYSIEPAGRKTFTYNP